MNVVDVLLLVVVAAAAVQGLRLGAVLQVLSFGGFLIGLFVGALLASVTVRWAHSEMGRTFVSLATMLGVAVAFGIVGRLIGAQLFKRLHRSRLGSIDSVLGVVIAVVASLLAVWLVASTLVNSSYVTLSGSIADSRIIRSLDRVLPPPPSVFSQVQGFLSAEGFPLVFAQLAPASAGPVTVAGSPQVQAVATSARSEGVSQGQWIGQRRRILPGQPRTALPSANPPPVATSAGPSTLKIIGQGCGDIQEGSGFVVAPGVVVTNAHVVAGVAHPMVQDAAGTHQTTVALFDPSYDLAVLRVQGLHDPSLALDPNVVSRGVVAAVLGYPGGGPFTAVPAGVMATFEAQGRDIYGRGLTVRDVYEIQAVVRPGNSGGPLVALDGQVIGVVFSRSTTNGDVGYALASSGVLSRVQSAENATITVGTGACVGN